MTDGIVIKDQYDLKDIAKDIKSDVYDQLNLDVTVRTKVRTKKRSCIEIRVDDPSVADSVYQIAKSYTGMVYDKNTKQYQVNFIPLVRIVEEGDVVEDREGNKQEDM